MMRLSADVYVPPLPAAAVAILCDGSSLWCTTAHSLSEIDGWLAQLRGGDEEEREEERLFNY